jgi:hypothetical protein
LIILSLDLAKGTVTIPASGIEIVKSGTRSVAGHLEVGLRDLLRAANVTNTRKVRRTREKIAEKKWKSRKSIKKFRAIDSFVKSNLNF